jgi:hypothetical protein
VYFDTSPLPRGYYYLTAIDANGNESAASATVSARLGGAGIAPQLSANTITARAGESKVAFSQVEQDVVGYNIYRQIFGETTGQKRTSALIPGTSFNDSVELNRVYTWKERRNGRHGQ